MKQCFCINEKFFVNLLYVYVFIYNSHYETFRCNFKEKELFL